MQLWEVGRTQIIAVLSQSFSVIRYVYQYRVSVTKQSLYFRYEIISRDNRIVV